MTDRRAASLSTAAAYQEVTLTELRALFDQVDVDLEDLWERERETDRELTELTSRLEVAGGALEARGATASIPATESPRSVTTEPGTTPRPSRYAVPDVPAPDRYSEIVDLANRRLGQMGVDLAKDPLVQVLPSSEISKSNRQYAAEYGEVDWDAQDWAVVLAAGAIATLIDIVLVRIPEDTTFLDREYSGSPITKWLKDEDRASGIHERFFKGYEAKAKVPYDVATTSGTGGRVSGMRPAIHRLQSFGHDPLLGLLVGVADLMRGSGTYVDKTGRTVRVASSVEPMRLIRAMLTQVRHILSDFYTPAGVPPPLFSLLQVGSIGSPFALGSSGVKVPWTDVARYMYVNGYDLRHFFTSGIVPATVTAIITGYWLLDGLARRGLDADRTRDRAKLASMLMLGHTIATSGNLVKTGLLFGMNPLALNWAQLLAMAPVTIAWIAETTARDARIRRSLDEEWQRLLTESEALARPTSAQ